MLVDLLERNRNPLSDAAVEIAPFGVAAVRITRKGLRVPFAPASEKWTGLIVRPRAFAGGLRGQLYLLWGAEDGVAAYELWRDSKLIAMVKREVEDGIPLMNIRYDDRNLEPGRKYEYRVRPIFDDGSRGELCEPFYGFTRCRQSSLRPLGASGPRKCEVQRNTLTKERRNQ